MQLAESKGVPKLFEPDEVANQLVDENSMMTYHNFVQRRLQRRYLSFFPGKIKDQPKRHGKEKFRVIRNRQASPKQRTGIKKTTIKKEGENTEEAKEPEEEEGEGETDSALEDENDPEKLKDQVPTPTVFIFSAAIC